MQLKRHWNSLVTLKFMMKNICHFLSTIGFLVDVFCPEVHDSCLTKICPPHQVCRHEPYQTPSCVCPEGRAGQFCESEDRCTDASCLNGKTQ